ncbi:MAG: glycosyltransferase family 4 protein [Methanomicrobiales archaeon]|nr:glycosyltransferase family 4 protein [Methanomicrobiales archaeon]MDI6877632.1 glycosyltransferase family 4 protein [Methanomicrobiales archaeon]
MVSTLLTAMCNPNQIGAGGKETHLLLLEKGLTLNGVDVQTAYPDFNRTYPINEYLNFFSYKRLQKNYRDYFSIQKLKIQFLSEKIKNELASRDLSKFNIIHAHDSLTLHSFKMLHPINSVVKVLTLHGYFPNEVIDSADSASELKNSSLYQFSYDIEKEGINFANFIIAVDKRIKDYVINKFMYPPEKIAIMPNATDTTTFYPIDKEGKNRLKKNFGFNEDQFIILVPRRLVPKNGVEYAIKAMQSINSQNVSLLVAGDGPLLSKLKDIAGKDTRIKFLGGIPYNQIHEYYKMSDVILIPSITSNDIQEATSLSMLEGMACGKIVACSDIGGMKDVIQNGKTGFLLPEKSPEKIANLIFDILNGCIDGERISLEASSYVSNYHSYISHARRIKDIYLKLLSKDEQEDAS